eukprot:2879976-Pyramimonas_sp.AAC.1
MPHMMPDSSQPRKARKTTSRSRSHSGPSSRSIDTTAWPLFLSSAASPPASENRSRNARRSPSLPARRAARRRCRRASGRLLPSARTRPSVRC